jgi:hypothetical protein
LIKLYHEIKGDKKWKKIGKILKRGWRTCFLRANKIGLEKIIMSWSI